MTRQQLLAGCVCLFVPAAANAAMIESTASVPLSPVELDTSLALDLFDPALGTLQSALFTATLDFETTGTAENTGGTSALLLPITVVTPVIDSSIDALDGAAPPVAVGAGTFTSLLPGQSTSIGYSGSSSNGGFLVSDPGVLSAFLGSGTFVVDILTNTMTMNAFAVAGLLLDLDTEATLGLSVIYEFEEVSAPIPVPPALPMMLGALGLVGYMGWRRRA